MPTLTSKLRARWRLCVVVGVSALFLFNAPRLVDAQGLIKGVEQGARQGNKAAGPVGGVLGGAIGGVVGAVTGVFTGAGGQAAQPAAKDNSKDAKAGSTGAKGSKAAKDAGNAAKQVQVLTQANAPELTGDQIVANSDGYIERIKKELNLTPDQEKNWSGFSSAMHYLGHNGAERLNLRVARARRDPPDDIIEQMRNEAQFLIDRAADQRNVADAAEPLFASLDDKQKQVFIEEMVRLSHERGLD
jgi:LTXXQ motif family protein